MQHPSPSSPLSHPLPLHSHTFPICQPREQNLQPGQSQQGSLAQKGRMHLQAPITASLSTPLRSFPPQKKKKKEKKIKLPKGVSAPQDRLGGKPAPQAPSSDSFSYSSNAGCSQHPSSLLRFSFGQRKHCRWQQCRPPYVSPIPNLSLKHPYFRAGRICLKSCMQSTAWTTAPIPTSSWNANPAANPSTKTTPSFREKGLEKAKRVRESKKLPSETTYTQ